MTDLQELMALLEKWHDPSCDFRKDHTPAFIRGLRYCANELETILRSPAFAEMARDAERYRYIQLRTRGIDASPREPQRFEFPLIEPVSNLMRGSMAGHLDAAIDAAASGGSHG